MNPSTRPRTSSLVLALPALATLAAIAPAPARALDVEPYAFAAVRDGEVDFPTGIACVDLVGVDCPVEATTDGGSDDAWGLGVALRLDGPWWLDLRGSRQETELQYLDFAGEPIEGETAPLDVTSLHAGVLYRFLDGRWSPFLTVAAGLARVESPSPTVERREIDLDRLSAGLGAGLLVDLGARVGLRLEARALWIDLPEDVGGDLDQGEASAAIRLRL